MTRKKNSVAQFDFGKVAIDTNSNINKDKDVSINVPNTGKDDAINDILKDHKRKQDTHIFKGFYLENEVANAIDTVTHNKGKGAKSELVNEIIKRYFKEAGRL